MISVITGTLNREEYLQGLINNTVMADDRLELVLVDGGSTDGTIPMMRSLAQKEPRIKFIEVGGRSPYPHYMNLGIKNASHDLICQWNDDVLLCNKWQDVLDEVDGNYDAYLFNWKYGELKDITDPQWLKCDGMRDNQWIIINNAEYSYPAMVGEKKGEVCMNYGIYKKEVFKKCGLYNPEYQYYCADSEMAMRAYYSGVKFKTCFNIKVCVLPAEKRAKMFKEDIRKHTFHCLYYTNTHQSGVSIEEIFSGEYL